MIILVVIAGALIAFANGQNDVSKGIATLVGSGVTRYRHAILWGALWTGVGGLAGAVVAGAMVTTFGNGLLAGGAAPTLATALAVLLGAAAWVLIATRTGLPVSTTHAFVGALTGVALVAFGTGGIRWDALQYKIVLPLLVTPVLALALTAMLLRATRRSAAAGVDCACLAAPQIELAPRAQGTAYVSLAAPKLVFASAKSCETQPAAVRVTMDQLHWATSAAASFARGLNDAPKIVALILAGAVLTRDGIPLSVWFAVVTAAMVAGSLYGGLRVARVLAERVTRMDHHEGFCANLVTAALVGLGAWQGLPLSTTHVSTGAIVGAGTARAGAIDWRTVRGLLLAWVITLPFAAVLAVGAYGLVQVVGL
jgi:inorganic phosphate transporter, PiT family